MTDQRNVPNTDTMALSIVDGIIDNPPKLHFWENEWNVGGFHTNHARALVSYALGQRDRRALKVVETGAGLSTAIFLALGAAEVISVAPDRDLFARIRGYLDSIGVEWKNLQAHEELSEEVLPGIAAAHVNDIDVGLIDGGHGWPTVFVDFCYINKMLKPGGTLFIDDLQLHSVHELFELLKQQYGFQFVEQINKLAIFKKTADIRYLPDFGAQPYIKSKPLLPLHEVKAAILRVLHRPKSYIASLGNRIQLHFRTRERLEHFPL
jgi:precorrin-6B methylase 2